MHTKIEELVDCYPHTEISKITTAIPQFEHRLNLLQKWSIDPGAYVLEIGCGQGECTLVLADCVGQTGFVTAVDPAPLDYGGPYTMQQARSHISASKLGSRINFIIDDPVQYLNATSEVFDVVVLCHCLWYFPSRQAISELFSALKGRAHQVSIAEYSLSHSNELQLPHVLAAKAQGLLYEAKTTKQREATMPNIRTLVSPASIREIMAEHGYKLRDEFVVSPPRTLRDGRWEAKVVGEDEFLSEVLNCEPSENRAMAVELQKKTKALLSNMGTDGWKKCLTMDVWIANFKNT